jgi:ribosomal protein S11
VRVVRWRLATALTAVLLISAVSGCASAAPARDSLSPATAKHLDADAAQLAKDLDIQNPPKVERVRMIALHEWAPTMLRCLNDEGLRVTLTDDREGISYPPDQDDAYRANLNLATYVCEVKYPVDPE